MPRIHKCFLNYHGSAINIFRRSIEKHRLDFTAIYGDGDIKTVSAVENIYGDHGDSMVVKYLCIGHYQKHVGNRLRKLRTELKLGGKNRLTN